MLSVVKPRVCPLCGEIYYLSDGRYKYCSDECAEKAQLKRRGGTVVKRHEIRRERERQQFLDDYWRRCTEAFKRNCKSNERINDFGAIPNWLDRILKDCRRRREQKRRLK